MLVELRAGTRQTTPELTDSMLLVVDGLSRLVLNPTTSEQDASDEVAFERLLPSPLMPTPVAPPIEVAPTNPVASSPLRASGDKDGILDRSLTLSPEGERETLPALRAP